MGAATPSPGDSTSRSPSVEEDGDPVWVCQRGATAVATAAVQLLVVVLQEVQLVGREAVLVARVEHHHFPGVEFDVGPNEEEVVGPRHSARSRSARSPRPRSGRPDSGSAATAGSARGVRGTPRSRPRGARCGGWPGCGSSPRRVAAGWSGTRQGTPAGRRAGPGLTFARWRPAAFDRRWASHGPRRAPVPINTPMASWFTATAAPAVTSAVSPASASTSCCQSLALRRLTIQARPTGASVRLARVATLARNDSVAADASNRPGR